MIRSHEKTHPDSLLSPRTTFNGRVPIFAVSASLVEREKDKYVQAGFDGWILKPIDFKRLNTLLQGIVDKAARSSCLYKPGEWEKGGWFSQKQDSILDAKTNPSKVSPVQYPPPTKETPQPDKDSLGSGDSQGSDTGTITPMTVPKRRHFHDERVDGASEEEKNEDSTVLNIGARVVDVTDMPEPAPSEPQTASDSEATAPV